MLFFRLFWTISLLIVCLIPSSSYADQHLDMQFFAKIPIQHDGRIKPLDSFARHLTQRLNGHDEIDNIKAIDFLAEALFNPAQTTTRPLFIIKDKGVYRLLNLPEDQDAFSLTEALPALQNKRETVTALLMRDDQSWSASERALVSLHDNVAEIHNTLKSLNFILPLRLSMPQNIQQALDISDKDTSSYLKLKRHEEKLSAYIKALPEDNITEELKAFIFQLSLIEENAEAQAFLRIMPPEWPLNKTREWQSPWILVHSGLGGPESKAYLDLWHSMATAYRAGDTAAWKQTTRNTFQKALSFSDSGTSERKLSLEITYHHLTPYFYSLVFYSLSAILAIFMLANRALPFTAITSCALVTGGLFHSVAIIMRIIILERPPVSTLFESVIFVSLICVICALIMAWFQKDKTTPLLIGALCGMLFHFVAGYLAKDGDTLQVLVAVLNTNFWLATHVVIITAGYGFCVITSLLAHFYIGARAIGRDHTGLIKTTLTLALISLLFTSVGTILGGIWADQSWGRFWGWDPKENGALLIVLWLIWLIHGRIAGQLREVGFMTGITLLNIIVALAWFGVNLLNVGLHSYGFINGIAWGLGLFCALEIAFTFTCILLIKQKKSHAR